MKIGRSMLDGPYLYLFDLRGRRGRRSFKFVLYKKMDESTSVMPCKKAGVGATPVVMLVMQHVST
eukprot:CAMPEP_0184383464 /NCGR_PEP_ID=MMETSP0007-20130409/7164_1 /TAXON_ID=97485 /ORGANISM="Prymnesium parvum, Strain Texoma1" /LENGTH=64 /DNA_ID=CAMNT_0026729957 /DNA_START=265 /DNA_END=456 /DNA_ORIENTATION=+